MSVLCVVFHSCFSLLAVCILQQFEKKFSKYFKAEGGSADGAKSSTKEEKKDSTKKKSSGGGSEVSRQERVKFSQMVNQLTSPQLGTMVNMIQKECPEALNEDDEDELEIEINNISGPVLLQVCSIHPPFFLPSPLFSDID